jgi:hypothetical protein
LRSSVFFPLSSSFLLFHLYRLVPFSIFICEQSS